MESWLVPLMSDKDQLFWPKTHTVIFNLEDINPKLVCYIDSIVWYRGSAGGGGEKGQKAT